MILGFIGTGKISSSIIFGIFKSKLKIKRIYISSRNRNIAKKLSKSYRKIKVLNNNQEIIDKKYLSWVAIIPGWFLGDFIGAISSFLLVRELVSDEDKDNTFELALLRISSLLIKSDGNISKSEINTVQKYFERAFLKKIIFEMCTE